MSEQLTETAPVADEAAVGNVQTPLQRFASDYFESKIAAGALFVLIGIIFYRRFRALDLAAGPL
jgi:hypothetical protein